MSLARPRNPATIALWPTKSGSAAAAGVRAPCPAQDSGQDSGQGSTLTVNARALPDPVSGPAWCPAQALLCLKALKSDPGCVPGRCYWAQLDYPPCEPRRPRQDG